MSKIARKLGVAVIGLVTIMGVSLPAAAQTSADLQAQITALLAQISALQAQLSGSTTPASTTTYNFTRDLTLGSTGEDVRALQQYLNSAGYTVASTGAGSVGNESAYFGALTQAALSNFQAANGVSPTAGYFGPITRAKIASLTPTTPVTPVTPVSAPLTVSLASDNPASANVQKGSANNPVLKLVFTGGSTATTVTGLTLQSYGTVTATGATDVSAVKLYDENGVQLGNTRTQAGNQVIFVMVPALTVPANGSRTVTVTADIASTTTNVMAVVRYGLASATAISGGATFTGNYPVIGNSYTIVPAGQLGALTVSQFGIVPKTTVKIGETNIILARLNVSAGSNENVAVNQVTVTNTGTLSDSDISNLRIVNSGTTTVVAGPATMSNNKVTFNFSSPVTVTKGSSLNFDLIGDIANGNTHVAQFYTADAVARGITSGVNVTASGTVGSTGVTIGNETVTTSMSANHPQGTNAMMVSSTARSTLAAFDVRSNGGDVIFNQFVVSFDAAANLDGTHYLSSVGLYDGDSLISDLQTVNTDVTSGGTNGQATFALNWTVPANTTKTLYVKGVTNTMAVSTSATVITALVSYSGYGLSSGAVVSGTPATPTTAVTVYESGTVTVSADSVMTPYEQGVLAPSINVTLGALKVQAQREDMRLQNLVLTPSATGKVSQITLYAEDGVTPLSNPVSEAGGVFTFSPSTGYINNIVFTKGVSKTILIKGNPTATQAGFTLTIADLANSLDFIGQQSSIEFDTATPWTGDFAFALSTPNKGTFNLHPEILTITKSSTSPSGSVSRGTFQTYASWDVVNNSATLQNLRITKIKFTSKSGLSTGLDDAADEVLFRVTDENGTVVFTGDATHDTLTKASGTIAFNADAYTEYLTVVPGETKKMNLQISTLDTSKWLSSQGMQWSIEAVGDVTVEDFVANGGAADGTLEGYVGYGAGQWTIPAIANTTPVVLP